MSYLKSTTYRGIMDAINNDNDNDNHFVFIYMTKKAQNYYLLNIFNNKDTHRRVRIYKIPTVLFFESFYKYLSFHKLIVEEVVKINNDENNLPVFILRIKKITSKL